MTTITSLVWNLIQPLMNSAYILILANPIYLIVAGALLFLFARLFQDLLKVIGILLVIVGIAVMIGIV